MKSHILRSALVLLVIFISLSVLVFSQEKNSGKTIDDSRLVRINLLIADEKGLYINDVNLDKIKLYEDGVEQKILTVEKKTPLSLGIIMDNSGSVRKRLGELTFAGKILTTNLLDGDEAFVIRFVGRETIEIVQDWTSKKKDLSDAIDLMYVEGGQSAVIDALYLSAEKMIGRAKTGTTKRYALVLITDGDERDSYYTLKDFSKLIAGNEMQVFVLAFPNPEFSYDSQEVAERLVRKIVKKTGGTYYTIRKTKKNDLDKEELVKALKATVFELRSQFVLTYAPTNKDTDRLKRKLRVEVGPGPDGEKRTVTLRESFT